MEAKGIINVIDSNIIKLDNLVCISVTKLMCYVLVIRTISRYKCNLDVKSCTEFKNFVMHHGSAGFSLLELCWLEFSGFVAKWAMALLS